MPHEASSFPHNATSEETQEGMRAFAARHGLRYERTGLLPPASEHLTGGIGRGVRRAGIRKVERRTKLGREWIVTTTRGLAKRPERFSENLCSGTLPGGLEGTLAHHGFLAYEQDRSGGDGADADGADGDGGNGDGD